MAGQDCENIADPLLAVQCSYVIPFSSMEEKDRDGGRWRHDTKLNQTGSDIKAGELLTEESLKGGFDRIYLITRNVCWPGVKSDW